MKSQTRSNVILFTTTFAIAFALTQITTTFAGAGTQSTDNDTTMKKIAPRQAYSVKLGNYTAEIYYTKLEDGD